MFLSSADFFFKIKFLREKFSNSANTIRVSNSLDPDQARRFVGPDLGPNYLQRLSADDTSRHGVKVLFSYWRHFVHEWFLYQFISQASYL